MFNFFISVSGYFQCNENKLVKAKKIDPPRLAFAICGSKEYLVNMYENKNKSVIRIDEPVSK